MKQEIRRLFKGIHHPRTLHKILKDNPEIVEYAKSEIEKYSYYEKVGYYIISIANDIEIKKCPVCGKELSYTQCIKNKKIFCSRSCSATYQFSHKKDASKKKRSTVKLPALPLFPINEKVTLSKLRCLYAGADITRLRYVIAKNSSILCFCQKALEKHKEYQTEQIFLYCIINNLKLKKCKLCGKKMNYYKSYTRPTFYCSSKCSHASSSYKEKQQKSHNNRKYEILVQRAREKNYGVITLRDDYKTSNQIELKCLKCNKVFSSPLLNIYRDMRCPSCDKVSSFSFEKKIRGFIYSLNIDFTYNKKVLPDKKELDIFVPSRNIAIECDGLYWHSSKNGKDRNYHLKKTKQCEEKGIFLIHIFEDEWREKNKIVKNRIKYILGKASYKIGARECRISPISNDESKKFLDKYHIQGNVSSPVRYGLFKRNRLIAVMTFGKSRFNKNYDWELLRYCTIPNFNIIGGASKLLNHFRNHHSGSIISYADKRWSDGNLYRKLGFIELKDSQPNYFYVKDIRRFSRNQFQKHKLKDILKKFDPLMTEKENMLANGYSIIWDCGNKVFSLE